MLVAQAWPGNVTRFDFWCVTDHYPDLVSQMQIQIRLMGNFGLNGSVPWHAGTNGSLFSV